MITTETTGPVFDPTATVIPTAEPADTDITPQLAEFFAGCISGMHRISGRFVKTTTTIDNGRIIVDLTRRRFEGDDCARRVILTISDPEIIPPAALPDEIGPVTQARLDVMAEDDTGPGAAA